jgi:hypothetical protein
MSHVSLWRVGRLLGHAPLYACNVEKSLRTGEGASNAKERRKPMTISPLADKPAPQEMLVEPARLAHVLVLVMAVVYDITCEKPMFHSAL